MNALPNCAGGIEMEHKHREGELCEYMAQRQSGRRSPDTQTKWVVAAFSAGILAVLGYLAVADRTRIESDASRALSMSTQNDKELAVVKADTTAIRQTLTEIRADQKTLLEAVRSNRGTGR
jgi:hypothetical protein